MFIPRRFLIALLVLVLSIGSADAQFFQNIFGFLGGVFNFLCPIAAPVFETFFNITLPDCIDIPIDPAPAPTKKKEKITFGTSAPVAPPMEVP